MERGAVRIARRATCRCHPDAFDTRDRGRIAAPRCVVSPSVARGRALMCRRAYIPSTRMNVDDCCAAEVGRGCRYDCSGGGRIVVLRPDYGRARRIEIDAAMWARAWK